MKAYVFLGTGFEEVEAVTPVDLLRRAGIEVVMVAVGNELKVEGVHKIAFTADALIQDIDCNDADLICLPGGVPGTPNLEACERLRSVIVRQYESGKKVAAICAAPSILGHLNILQGKKACCYPGYEKELIGAIVCNESVVVDGNVITGAAMGASVLFGLKLVEVMCGKETAENMRQGILYR